MGVPQEYTKFLALCAIMLTITFLLPSAVIADQRVDGIPVNGCSLETGNGVVPDRDCDGIDDFHDNCEAIANSEQRDANRNGIGDECDLVITRVLLDPGTQVPQGSYANIALQLQNNKAYALNDIQARVRNQRLGLDLSTSIDQLNPGETRTLEFVAKTLPCTTPGKYELTITTDHNEGEKTYTQTTYQRLLVEAVPGQCASEPTLLDHTVLDTITHQEVIKGEAIVYPFTLTNLNPDTATYHVSLEDINHIGTYRIDPSPTVTIPTGDSATLFINIQTESFTPVGRNTLHAYVESNNAIDEVPLSLRVIEPVTSPLATIVATALQLALILIVLALIIGAAIIAYKKVNEDNEDGKGKNENESQTTTITTSQPTTKKKTRRTTRKTTPQKAKKKTTQKKRVKRRTAQGRTTPPKKNKATPAIEKLPADEEFESYY